MRLSTSSSFSEVATLVFTASILEIVVIFDVVELLLVIISFKVSTTVIALVVVTLEDSFVVSLSLFSFPWTVWTSGKLFY